MRPGNWFAFDFFHAAGAERRYGRKLVSGTKATLSTASPALPAKSYLAHLSGCGMTFSSPLCPLHGHAVLPSWTMQVHVHLSRAHPGHATSGPG